MERLTFEGNFCDIAQCRELPCPYNGACSQRKVWERLKAYEDTGLTPEEVNDLASVREIPPEAEYAINKHADSIIERLDKLLAQTDDDVRLRELAEADRDGRLVVLPCKVGDTVYEVTSRKTISKYRVKAIRIELFCTVIEWDIVAGFFDKSIFGVPVDELGKTVFLTHEEAEAALEATKDA